MNLKKNSKNISYVAEATIMEDKSKIKTKPSLPSIKDTVQILNKVNARPLVPSISETVLLDKQCIQFSNRNPKENGKKQVNKPLVEPNLDENNIKITETRLFIERKKKERIKKNKFDLLEKKKLSEERKKKLDQLKKTTRELAKASVKKNVSQTCSTPQKHLAQSKILLRDLESSFNNDIKNIIATSPKVLRRTNTATQTKLFDQKLLECDVSKPENLFSSLKLNEFNQLIGGKICDTSTPKLVDLKPLVLKDWDDEICVEPCLNSKTEQKLNSITLTEQKSNSSIQSMYNNDAEKIKELGNSKLDKKKNSIALSQIKSDISVQCINKIDTGTVILDLQLPNYLNTKILNHTDHSEIFQEPTIKSVNSSFLSCQKYCSESTQTNNCNNELSLFSPKTSPPPMNVISVLISKNRLQQQTEKNNLELFSNLNQSHTTEIGNTNVPNVIDCDKMVHSQNFIHNVQDNCSGESIEPESNYLFSNTNIENIVCEEKRDIVHNDKLNTKFNKITNEDIKEILIKLNDDFGFLTKNNFSYTNDVDHDHLKSDEYSSINSSFCFPNIHEEFQAELNTLDQLNSSLCDLEKMNFNLSINTKEHSVDDELHKKHCSSNDLSLKTTFYNNDLASHNSLSKLNNLSSNVMSVDKTITGFSIQMFEQLIKDEELRAKQHHTILHLREKSLINRLKWEVNLGDIQVKNLKNRPNHEKQIQLFKQQQRGRIKKLEYSLSQVKRLGKVIDSVYKQRLIMLEEHLQHLRMQSSSKKVMRKLKSLEPIPKKDEYVCRSLNSYFLKQCEKNDVVDTIENKQGQGFDSHVLNTTLKNSSTSPIMIELDNPNKKVLTDQATSPINIETKYFQQLKNIEVQTNVEHSLPCNIINQPIKTTNKLSNHNHNETVSNELSDVCLVKDIEPLIPVLPLNPAKTKQCVSETSASTNSEQSDLDVRITDLQGQLETRRLESLKLKKEQKKLRLENLKAKEQDLLKQIELYDKKIEESRKSLMVEIEKKNNQKYSIKYDFSKVLISNSVPQVIIDYENNHISQKDNKSSRLSSIIPHLDANNYSSIATKKSINNDISLSQDSLMFEGQQKILKENLDECIENVNNNCNEIISDGKCKNQLIQNLEKNQVQKTTLSEKKSSSVNVNSLKEIQPEVNYIILNSQPIIGHTLNDLEENSNEDISNKNPKKVNEVDDLNVEASTCEYSVQNSKTLNTQNKECDFEKNTVIESSSVSHDIHFNNFVKSTSNNSGIQRQLCINLNKNDSGVYEKKDNYVGQLEILNNEIEIDDDYSTDFTSDENTSEFQRSYEVNKPDYNTVEDEGQNNESSYEEERSEGDVIYEDKTFIEHYSDDNGKVQNMQYVDEDKVDIITNSIFNCLLKDTKKILKSSVKNPFWFFSENNDFVNLTEETPLLMTLKREKDYQQMIFFSEQATQISDKLFKRHLRQILSETIQIYYLPKLNETETETLSLYLNWFIKIKKLKLPDKSNFQHKTDYVNNEESFEIFYQKYQEQKKIPACQNESSDVMLTQTQREAKKLKLEQMRIEEEIERLRMSEEAQFFLREIPNKPPPPYKSPTKKKSLVDIPYTSDEVHKIILVAASQLYKNSQNSMPNDYIKKSDSSLHADYKTLIFDYCKEIAQDTFINEENAPLWKKKIVKLKHFRSCSKNPKDLSDLVVKKISQIVDIDECEEKVNKFVVKQMHEEDSNWTDFQMDELDIQNDIVQSLMKKLICDTITNIKQNFCLKFVR